MFRWLRKDCIQLFKYLHNYYDVDYNNLFCVNVLMFHCTWDIQLKLSNPPQRTNVDFEEAVPPWVWHWRGQNLSGPLIFSASNAHLAF